MNRTQKCQIDEELFKRYQRIPQIKNEYYRSIKLLFVSKTFSLIEIRLNQFCSTKIIHSSILKPFGLIESVQRISHSLQIT